MRPHAQLADTRVLLLGSNERAALSVCRSLGRQGAWVEIIGFDHVRQAAELSRYCRQRHFFGAPGHDLAAFLDRFEAHLQHSSYDAIFPITDMACELAYARDATWPAPAVILGPAPQAYREAVDKAKAMELARRVGLCAPPGLLLRHGDDIAPALALLREGPVYAKPTRSCLLDQGTLNTFEVLKCTTPEQLERKLAEDLPRLPVLIQKPVRGHGLGLNFLADRGQLIAASKNLRLHEPPDGGGSSFRCNMPLNARDLQIAGDMAAELNWSGLAMVEVKQDGDQLAIMEMNCRPWGSIETAIRAGVDFPALAVAQALGLPRPGDLVRGDRPVRVRNLKNDLRWVIGRRRHWLSRSSPLLEWLSAPLRALRGKEHLDIEQADDPWPAIGQLNPVFHRLWRRGVLALRMAALRIGHRHRFRRLEKDAPLLFLCQGNINRSAVAESLFRRGGFTKVRSAGMLPLRGRGISPAAARFLCDRGLDGAAHRSRSFHDCGAFVDEGAAIVVFDARTMAEVQMARADIGARVIMFADLSRDGLGELHDPHGATEAAYRACFERIETAQRDQTR